MNLPEPLPESDDLQHKALYSWLNRLRDYAQSITPMRGTKGLAITRTPAGTIHAGPPKPPSGEQGVRSVNLWYLPPVTIDRYTADFVYINSFVWLGLIGFGPYVTTAAANVFNFSGYSGFGSDTNFFMDYGVELETFNDVNYKIDPIVFPELTAQDDSALNNLAFYMVDPPPTIRNQISNGGTVGGTQQLSNQESTGLREWYYQYAYQGGNANFGTWPFDMIDVEYIFGSGAATNDYRAYLDPPYFPGSTLYIAKPNRWSSPNRFFYHDAFYDAYIELNPGWVDLNVDARRWMPAGLVENHMTISVGLNGSGELVQPGDGVDQIVIPVNQDSFHNPTG